MQVRTNQQVFVRKQTANQTRNAKGSSYGKKQTTVSIISRRHSPSRCQPLGAYNSWATSVIGKNTRSISTRNPTACGARPSNLNRANITTDSWWTGNGATTPPRNRRSPIPLAGLTPCCGWRPSDGIRVSDQSVVGVPAKSNYVMDDWSKMASRALSMTRCAQTNLKRELI